VVQRYRVAVGQAPPTGHDRWRTDGGERGLARQATHWFTSGMVAPLPEPDPQLDPNQPVPDDPAELLPDAAEPLPPPPIESTPDDPGGDPGGVPEPA
jgi:hypothetical protein